MMRKTFFLICALLASTTCCPNWSSDALAKSIPTHFSELSTEQLELLHDYPFIVSCTPQPCYQYYVESFKEKFFFGSNYDLIDQEQKRQFIDLFIKEAEQKLVVLKYIKELTHSQIVKTNYYPFGWLYFNALLLYTSARVAGDDFEADREAYDLKNVMNIIYKYSIRSRQHGAMDPLWDDQEIQAIDDIIIACMHRLDR